jgi:hypothetical protein
MCQIPGMRETKDKATGEHNTMLVFDGGFIAVRQLLSNRFLC